MPTVQPNSTIVLYGATPLGERANLERILTTLDEASLTPTGWSFDERTNLPYEREEVLSKASPDRYSLYLRHRGEKKNEVTIELGRWPEIRVEFDRIKDIHWKDVFVLSDELTKVYRPDIALTSIGFSYESPWKSELERDAALIHAATNLFSKDYRKCGPIALAPRTYFGAHYVMQFGRDLLLSTPAASVREDDVGGITIDLAPTPWNVSLEEFVEAWRLAMDHLRPAEVFAITHIRESGLKTFKRAPRCHIGGVIKT